MICVNATPTTANSQSRGQKPIMKLATLKTGGRDGKLIVVSQDLKHAVAASEVAPNLQTVLDDWHYQGAQAHTTIGCIERRPRL